MGKILKDKIRQPVTGKVAKVPVILQMESLECGAACVAMILAYYDKWIPLEQLREDCGVSRDGVKASNLVRTLRAYGLKSTGYFFELEKLKSIGQFPCILHWGFHHFVVLKGFRDNKAYINDPAKGDMVVSEEEIDNEYTGVTIICSPGENFCPSGKKKSNLRFILRPLKGTGAALILVASMTAVVSLVKLILTGFSRFFMDHMLGGENPDLVVPFITAMAVFSAIEIIASWIQAIYTYRVIGKFAAAENTRYFWHVLNLPLRFFSQRMVGDIEQRRTQSANIAHRLIFLFAPLVINSFMLFFYLLVMIQHSIIMTVVGIVSVMINLAVIWWSSNKRINITRVMMRDESKLYAATIAGIQIIETLKASGAENGFFKRWAGYQAGVTAQKTGYHNIDIYLQKMPEFISSVADSLILVMGAYMVMKGQFTPGMVLAFAGLLTQFFAPAKSLVLAGQEFQEMYTEMERIDDVMNYPEDPSFREIEDDTEIAGSGKTAENEKAVQKLSGRLHIHDLSFGYSKLSPPVIEGFNLDLYQGKSVALVGSSGCGKSTIGRLIAGLYQPWSGEILFDGKRICEIDRDIFSGSVAVVNQFIIMFEDTIDNNLRMWDRSIEDYEIIMAARDARIHDDIMNRNGGYQYRLTEGGAGFSGGQRQRLEIARVLAQDPSLIILDEATNALDAQTEYEVVRSIRDRGISSIVIAHRLSTIRDCDEILVIDHGRVAERGTHEELMARNGLYTSLVLSE